MASSGVCRASKPVATLAEYLPFEVDLKSDPERATPSIRLHAETGKPQRWSGDEVNHAQDEDSFPVDPKSKAWSRGFCNRVFPTPKWSGYMCCPNARTTLMQPVRYRVRLHRPLRSESLLPIAMPHMSQRNSESRTGRSELRKKLRAVDMRRMHIVQAVIQGSDDIVGCPHGRVSTLLHQTTNIGTVVSVFKDCSTQGDIDVAWVPSPIVTPGHETPSPRPQQTIVGKRVPASIKYSSVRAPKRSTPRSASVVRSSQVSVKTGTPGRRANQNSTNASRSMSS